MDKSSDTLRVIIAVTEPASLPRLWHEAVEAAGEKAADMLALIIDDERWDRAASLPFTREIPKFGGAAADFTLQRAKQVSAETAEALRTEISRLAAEAGRAVGFEMLPVSDEEVVKRLLDRQKQLLIGSASLRQFPIFSRLTEFKVEIRLIDPEDSG